MARRKHPNCSSYKNDTLCVLELENKALSFATWYRKIQGQKTWANKALLPFLKNGQKLMESSSQDGVGVDL